MYICTVCLPCHQDQVDTKKFICDPSVKRVAKERRADKQASALSVSEMIAHQFTDRNVFKRTLLGWLVVNGTYILSATYFKSWQFPAILLA